PYEELQRANAGRGTDQSEVELWDLGVFDEDRYFDVTVEYAKRAPNDILMVITVENRGPDEAPIHVLPHLWFRNTWRWSGGASVPCVRAVPDDQQGDDPHDAAGFKTIRAEDRQLGDYFFYVEGSPELLFTENDSNGRRLWNVANATAYVKDAFHDVVVGGDRSK